MNVFTEEVLDALQNGNTPSERINNAMNLVRFRNLSVRALSDLLSDIKRNGLDSIRDESWRTYDVAVHEIEVRKDAP